MDAQIYLKERYLRTAFKIFDLDNSGKIDREEIGILLSGEEFRDVYT